VFYKNGGIKGQKKKVRRKKSANIKKENILDTSCYLGQPKFAERSEAKKFSHFWGIC
jgi:hypothetical protein